MKLFVVANEVGIYVFDNMDSANNFNRKVGESCEMITEIFPDCQTAIIAWQERKAMIKAFEESQEETHRGRIVPKEEELYMEEYYRQFVGKDVEYYTDNQFSK